MSRQSWKISFQASDKLRDAERHSGNGETGDPCARGEWCSAARVVVLEDGTRQRVPARSPRAFCDACSVAVATYLDAIPAAYGRLAGEIGEKPRHGRPVRVPFGPRLPLREDIDALMRLTAVTLRGWEARTRAMKQLTPPEDVPVHSAESVVNAAATLGTHLSVMLALQPGWMTRSFDLHPGRRNQVAAITRELQELEEVHGDREIIRIGVDFISLQVPVGGVEAGLEVAHLHYRARRVLGETKAPPEAFDGVPCRQCGDIALERAEPPSDPKVEAKHSRCASCRHEMDYKTFDGWSKWYAGWAGHGGVAVCKRCQRGRHGECGWAACSCAAEDHQALIAA